MIFNI
jgi:hypothetical protein